MKKLLTLVMIAVLSLTGLQTKAQAFDKSTKIISLGIGGADMFHIPMGYNSYLTNFYTPLTGEFYVQGEFAVHKYVGVGFTAGIGGTPGGVRAGYAGVYSGYYPEFNIPIGAIANFHFYQLIADKTGKNIHADKLDIYAGLNLGSGIAIHTGGYYDNNFNYHNGAFNDILFFAGFQAGARYYFTDKIGVYGEFGFSKSFINAGITFKLGGSKGGGGESAKKKK